MGILIGIIQSFMNALGMTITKKVVENKKIGNNWQTFFSRTNHALLLLILFFISYNVIEIEAISFLLPSGIFTPFNIVLFLASVSGLYITYPLRRIAYANEKVTTLQPFAMLFQVFPVIIGFIFIASERVNIITFLMALLASFIVIGTSIDFKNFNMNKYSVMVLSSSIIKSVQVFAVIYFLSLLSPTTFYFIESLVIVCLSFFLIFIKNEFSQIKLITKKYAKLLIVSNIIVIISILLGLTMYKSLGIVATSLFMLLYLVFVYILTFFLLKERPSKKDILVTIIVALCIIVGMYFKQ